MPFVITDPCIGTKDTACVDVCPVDCIHPRKDEPEFEAAPMLFIHPDECIDCGACVPACPVVAIYDSIDSTPSSQKELVTANSVYRGGDADAVAKAVAIVQSHIETHPELMAIDPKDRQAKTLQGQRRLSAAWRPLPSTRPQRAEQPPGEDERQQCRDERPWKRSGKWTLRSSGQRAERHHRAERDRDHGQVGAQDRRIGSQQSDRQHDAG